MNAAAFFGLAATIAPTVAAIVKFVVFDDDLPSALVFAVFLVFLLTLSWFYVRRHRTRPLPVVTKLFRPFDRSNLSVWSRPQVRDELMAAATGRTMTVVVGASGAGKTVLLQELKLDLEGDGWIVHYFDSYRVLERLAQKLRPARGTTKGAKPRVFVLDQFEHFLASMETDPMRRDWLREKVRPSEVDHFIVSIRSEWFYELRVLGDLAPSPKDCVEVRGIDPDAPTDEQTLEEVVGGLAEVTSGAELPLEIVKELSHDGAVLPIELQIVGAVLERRVDEVRPGRPNASDLQKMGGATGAATVYFDEVLRAAPNERVAMKLLLALAVRPKFREPVDPGALEEILFEQPRDIQDALDFLRAQGLITQRGGDDEIAHDYVADHFHQRSGSVLDPVDRDNITYHFETHRSASAPRSEVVKPQAPAIVSRFGLAVGTVLAVSMVLRLIGFGVRVAVPWSPIAPIYVYDEKWIDVAYLPAFVSHAVWALYIFLFYERILRRLVESKRQAVFSAFTFVNMASCVVVAMFFPEFWIIAIGWGGLVLSLKLWVVARRPELTDVSSQRLRDFAATTGFNLTFAAAAGVVGATFAHQLVSDSHENLVWTAFGLMFCIPATWACWALAPSHVTQAAASRTLGLLARRGPQVTRDTPTNR